MAENAKRRAVDRIERLTREGLDLVAFWSAAADAIKPAVPYDASPCWFTLDPASLLATSHYQDGLPEIPGDWLAREYYEDDFNKMAHVARSPRGVATLLEATGGDLSRSPRYGREMVPYGAEHELMAGLRTASGEIWGVVSLYREKGDPAFDDTEIGFMREVAPLLAQGARRALLVGEAADPEGPDAPGLLVLTEDWEIESATPGVERWMTALPDGDWARGLLPSSVLSVAGQAMRSATSANDPDDIAFARVRSRGGQWVVLHGAALVSDGSRRVAVIVEPAHPARISSLLMSAYQLTEREQDVTQLVLQGSSTAQIAEALFISVHTVQQHLKSVFEKTGVRSRRDLVGKIFFAHYEPRVRDNERRASGGLPIRGGPAGTLLTGAG